jgi:general stress protein YciG
MSNEHTQTPEKKARGFAAMDAKRQREIASQGGKAAHQSGNAHEFTADEARAAGRKGGQTVSQNREHMAMIGRAGGRASRGGGRRRAEDASKQPTQEKSAENTTELRHDAE